MGCLGASMLFRALLLILLLTPLAAAAGDPRPVRILRAGGDVIAGILVTEGEDGYLVATPEGQVFVPAGEVEELTIGDPVPTAAPTRAPVAEPPGPVPTWVVVQTVDGRTLSGTLVAENAEAVTVLSGGAEVAVPRTIIERMASGPLDAPTASGAPGVPAAGLPGVPAAGLPPAGLPPRATPAAGPPRPPTPGQEARDFQAAYLRAPGWASYADGRLLLVDRRGRPLGPKRLGFSARAFGRDNRRAFHAVHGGAPDLTLSFEEFLAQVGDDRLEARFRELKEEVEGKVVYGTVGTILGGSLLAASPLWATASVGSGNSDLFAAVPISIGTGVPFLISGIFSLASGDKWTRRLKSDQLWVLFTRQEAWEALQEHNGDLRAEQALPDDARLDAAEQ